MKERKERKTFPACDDAFQHFSALITVFTQLSHPSLPNLICFPGQSLFRPCTRIKLLFLSAVARSCARQQHSERELCESGLCVLARLRKSITITRVSGRRLSEIVRMRMSSNSRRLLIELQIGSSALMLFFPLFRHLHNFGYRKIFFHR